ncbi:hypothetical protein ACTU6V_06090 [Microbacterium sp. A204]|uniref:hypothetical protein n=1 Tax=Microbacterium sp. A204 TaxID=3457321 RepID=UPI003FD62C96
MTDQPGRRSRGLTIALLIVAVVIVVGTIIVVVSATRGGQISASARPSSSAQPETSAPADPNIDTEEGTVQPSPSPFTGAVLPEPMGGQEAIDALGDKIEIVAKRNAMTVEELEELLLRDKTAQVSTTGFIVYIDTFKNEG